MPFAIVETVDPTGKKKMIVVPERWVESKQGKSGILRWPDSKSDKNLKGLLEDGQSTPTASWDTRECKIICQNVPTKSSGEKTIEIIKPVRNPSTTTGNITVTNLKANSTILTRAKKQETANVKQKEYVPNEASPKETLIVVEETQPNEILQEPFCDVVPKEEAHDPFEDVVNPSELIQPAMDNPSEQTSMNASIESETETNEQRLLSLLGIENPGCNPSEDADPAPQSSRQGRKISKKSSVQIPRSKKRRLDIANDENALKDDANALKNDAKYLLSCSDDEAEGETPEELESFSKVIDMVCELRSVVEMHQKEIQRMVSDGLKKINATVRLLLEKKVTGNSGFLSDDEEEYEFELLTTVAAVERFDDRLNDAEYRKKIHRWVYRTLNGEKCGKRGRMGKMLYMIFDRNLLVRYSWSGRKVANITEKNPFHQYTNILTLFSHIGSSGKERMSMAGVEEFFKYKLKYVTKSKKPAWVYQSGPTLKNRTLPLVKRIPSNRLNAMHTVRNTNPEPRLDKGTQDKCTDVGESATIVQYKNNIEKEQAEASTSQTKRVAVGDLPEIIIHPIKSMAQMEGFENALKDETRQKQVQRWIDRTVGSIADIKQRKRVLLERLIDKNFLLNFYWKNTNSGEKYSLAQYKQFVRLFEYASRAKLDNNGSVSSFFTNKLDDVP